MLHAHTASLCFGVSYELLCLAPAGQHRKLQQQPGAAAVVPEAAAGAGRIRRVRFSNGTILTVNTTGVPGQWKVIKSTQVRCV